MKGTMQILGMRGAVLPLPREDAVLELTRGQMLRLKNAKGTTIRVVAGAVWVTQDHDARDLVLATGDDFTCDRHGLAVAVPLTDDGARLVLGDARTSARRALAWLPLGRPRLA
ncbi:MAG TPA: DUF2917 domain-containing protein [Noviherbaspirillum sp.]|nr:DUF2917 domain-containing protein [Noviherbaspirillum sp.]